MDEAVEVDDDMLQDAAYEGFKKMVMDFSSFNGPYSKMNDPAVFSFNQIRAQRLGGVHTVPSSKIYRPIMTKGALIKNNFVVPFGFKP